MFKVSEEIKNALDSGRPVVALETAVLTHGMPKEIALDAYREMIDSVTSAGAIPAPTGILKGVLAVGLSLAELAALLADTGAKKAALPDLPVLAAKCVSGGTTAGATLFAAGRTGIKIMATGGIGGAHRGVETSFDISGDLYALSRYGGAVVCSGAKSLCDLPKTMEMLETLGVPVVGYQTNELPGFTSRKSGVALVHRADSPEESAKIVQSRDRLRLSQAVLIANPPPVEFSLSEDEGAKAIEKAVEEAKRAGIGGQAVTPWILDRMELLTGGASLKANRALLNSNAALAAAIAVRLCGNKLPA